MENELSEPSKLESAASIIYSMGSQFVSYPTPQESGTTKDPSSPRLDQYALIRQIISATKVASHRILTFFFKKNNKKSPPKNQKTHHN